MADIERKTFPVPPKRPTVIRTDTNGPALPARPAPPVPGGRPPPIPSRQTDGAPALPRRPSIATVPARPGGAPLPQPAQQPERPVSISAGSVRKRPEITIVCARPMSEVGFRSDKGAVSQPPPTPEKTPEVPGKPPPPAHKNVSPSTQQVPSSTVKDDLLIDFESECIPIPTISASTSHPAPKLSGARLPPPKPTPARGAPSVPKTVDAGQINVQEDSSIIKAPPLPAKRPGPPATAPKISNVSTSENTSEPVCKPPRAQPPKVPSKSSDTHTNSELQSINSDASDLKLQTNSDSVNETEDIYPGTDVAQNQISTPSHRTANTGDEYAVINKSKRPTIIRPGRPVTKESTVTVDSDAPKCVRIPPSPSPRMARKETEASGESRMASQKTDVKSMSSSTDQTPEFLKLKLKTTTDQSAETVTVGAESKTETFGVTKRPPPTLAPKPKPGILPKPQLLAKPKFSKDTNANQTTTESKNEIVTDDHDINAALSDMTSVKDDEQQKDEERKGNFDISKPAAVKRPTIIRPAKSSSTEKLNSSDYQSNNDKKQEHFIFDNENVNKTMDDSQLRSKPRPQPPLPSRRPVSMINIPKTVEHDINEIPSSKSMSFASGDTEDKPKPVPRPAARTRPMSMAVPSGRQAVDFEEKSSAPPRPHHGPAEHETSRKVPIGVAVLPQAGKSEMFGDMSSQLKPSRRPPPPKVSPKTAESSSSEEETKSSPRGPPKPGRASIRPPPPKVSPKKDEPHSSDEEIMASPLGPPKPSRPSVRPPPPKAPQESELKDGDSSEEEFHSVVEEPSRPPPPAVKQSPDMQKPERPGLPPPRKSSIKEEAEKDNKMGSSVTTRPPKPEARPSRPLSTPEKVHTSPGVKPSRPGSRTVKKKGVPELPSRPGPGHPLYHHMMKAAHGVALHDFTASQQDELSIKTGEVIILLKSIDAEWIVGKNGEKEGMFPRSFIKVKIPLPGEIPDEDSDSESDAEEMFYDASSEKPDLIGHGPRCRARFDFDGEGPEDLVFEDGEVIKLLERVGPEWRKGELNGRVGLFPLSFVEIIEDLPADGATDEASVVVKAMFDYEGQDDELSFQRGDTITVQYKVNDEWLYGECGGRKGQFPVPFVDHMPANLPPFPAQEATAVKDPLAEAESLWGKEEHSPSSQHEATSPHPSPKQSTQSEEVPYCIAIYDFPGETEGDLSFVTGDRIELLEHVGNDWLKGSLQGVTGMFPAGFVEIHKDLTGTLTTTEHHEDIIYGVAQYDFRGETDSELTFEAGARLRLLETVEGAEDWRWGELDGHRGMFPAAFVQAES